MIIITDPVIINYVISHAKTGEMFEMPLEMLETSFIVNQPPCSMMDYFAALSFVATEIAYETALRGSKPGRILFEPMRPLTDEINELIKNRRNRKV